jgi:Fe-S oxidoreductase
MQQAARSRQHEKVLFYSGCLADFVYPEMCMDTKGGLERLGYQVSFPQRQTCCGIPARYSGEMEVARDMARINIDVLLEEDADYVVTICPTCTMSLRHDFPKLLEKEPGYLEKARELAAKTFNFSELAALKVDHYSDEASISRSGQGGKEEATQAYRSVRRGADDATNAAKLENIAATEALTVAVDCPGCKLQIEGGLEAAGSHVTVEHTATLVARKLGT